MRLIRTQMTEKVFRNSALMQLRYIVYAALLCVVLGGTREVYAVNNISDRLEEPATYFSNMSNALFIDIAMVGDRLVAVGERGSIVYSDDAGQSWSPANVPVSSLLTAVYFPDNQNGWAVGHGGIILRTSDSGQNWVKQFDGNQANRMTLSYLQEQYAELQKEFEVADEYDKEDIQYAMEDMEFALEDAQIDADIGPSKPLLDVWFRNASEGYVVGAYGFFFHTTDGGQNWEYAADRLENFDRYHLNAMTLIQGGALLIVGEAGQMFASYDDGETWETLYGPYQGSFFGLQAMEQEESVIAFGLRGNMFRSDDAGSSWQRIDLPIDTTLTSSTITKEGHLVVVGFSGVILSSKDNGESFTMNERTSLNAYNSVISSAQKQLLVVGAKGIEMINE